MARASRTVIEYAVLLLSAPGPVRSIYRTAIESLDLHDKAIAVSVGPHLGKNLIQAFGCGLDVLQPNVTSHVNGLLPTVCQDNKL